MKRLTYKIEAEFVGRLPGLRERPVRSLPAVTVSIETDVPLVWQLQRTAYGVLATCERLALTLEADDETEAQGLVAEGLELFFLDHVESGTFNEFLARLGWKAELPEGLPVLRFDVPWHLSA